jgi:hypothetical protein
MDDGASYDYRELIQTYIQTQRNDRRHPAFKNYYTGLLTQLEQMFEVDFASPPSSQLALWRLFRTTVASYLSLRTPWSGFLEAGLIVQKIKDLGSQGEKIFLQSTQIEEGTQTSRELHLQLLSDLFECIYGKRDLVVTSQDLAARGFDTSKEPQAADYWEEI